MSYTFTQTGSEIQAILDRAETGGQLDQDIAAKQDALTFDDEPTENSDNPVKSGGIYDALAEKADIDGDYPELTAGTAEQVLATTGITNKVPYLFRQVPSGAGKRLVDKLVGGTVAWNQLAKATARTHSSGVVMSVNDDGFCVLNGTASSSDNSASINTGVTSASGHKYFVKSGTTAQAVRMRMASSGSYTDLVNGAIWNGNGQGFGAVTSIVSGTTYTDVVCPINIIDLTLAFGSTIADYLYNLESGTAGAGIAKLREWGFLTKPYYAYNAGALMSVNAGAHKTYDEDGNIIGNYALDASLTLRGLYKLDASNNLYCDGDEYESDGTVTRKYGIVDLGDVAYNYGSDNLDRFTLTNAKNGSENLIICGLSYSIRTSYSAIYNTDKTCGVSGGYFYIHDSSHGHTSASYSGVYLLYELATPTTETATPFINPQICDPNGTEEYTDASVEAGTRDVAVPVGHETEYPTDLVAEIERVMVAVPVPPTSDGSYTLQVDVSGGVPTYGWASGGVIQTLSMASPTPTLSLNDRIGDGLTLNDFVSFPSASEPEVVADEPVDEPSEEDDTEEVTEE